MRGTRYPEPHVSEAYRRSGAWEGRVLAGALDEAAEKWPSRVAVADAHGQLTFAELRGAAAGLAREIADAGTTAGDVVSVQLPNGREALAYVWAALSLGAVVNPIVPIYRGHELSQILDASAPSFVVTPLIHRGCDYRQVYAQLSVSPNTVVRHVELGAGLDTEPEAGLDARSATPSTVGPVGADDIALLLYTSGTTASPKGVLHSHNTLRYEVFSQASVYELTEDDVVFMPSPVTHITGFLWGCLAPVLLGLRVVFQDRWDAEQAWQQIRDHKATFTMVSAPFIRGLSESPSAPSRRLSHIRIVACGGADMSAELIASAQARIGPTYRLYGASECPSVVANWPNGPDRQREVSDGYPFGATMVKVIDDDQIRLPAGTEGEIVWQGPDMFLGYLDADQNAGAFTSDGFGRSGDLGVLDPDGSLRVSGRLKDIINRSGEKFSARDIEEVLLAHPAVIDVAVVASPDAQTGERVCAYVIPAGEGPTLLDLREHLLRRGLALQKVPERLVVVRELPRTPSGKIQKSVLREWEWTPDNAPARQSQRVEERTR
ncbi:AMP-binding protein [Streptomyces malaysiensis]|uniref:AMP-binding protein n=1 Tax=Streptomyces malaysiensis TaxID=92644 RepID=UPI0037119F10